MYHSSKCVICFSIFGIQISSPAFCHLVLVLSYLCSFFSYGTLIHYVLKKRKYFNHDNDKIFLMLKKFYVLILKMDRLALPLHSVYVFISFRPAEQPWPENTEKIESTMGGAVVVVPSPAAKLQTTTTAAKRSIL